jgi:hypothetical protein
LTKARRHLLVEIRCNVCGQKLSIAWREDSALLIETVSEHGPTSLQPNVRDRMLEEKRRTGRRVPASVDVVATKLTDVGRSVQALHCENCGPVYVDDKAIIREARLADVFMSRQVMRVVPFAAQRM